MPKHAPKHLAHPSERRLDFNTSPGVCPGLHCAGRLYAHVHQDGTIPPHAVTVPGRRLTRSLRATITSTTLPTPPKHLRLVAPYVAEMPSDSRCTYFGDPRCEDTACPRHQPEVYAAHAAKHDRDLSPYEWPASASSGLGALVDVRL